MKKKQRKWRSLRLQTFRVILVVALILILVVALILILVVALILILVASATGLALYGYNSLRNYKMESRHLINYALSMEDQAYLEKLVRETRKTYEEVPEEIRKDMKSDEFIEPFLPLLDEDFLQARDVLEKCRVETEQRNVSLIFADQKHSAIVFVVDGDDMDLAYMPGQWIETNLDVISRVWKSSWFLWITYGDEYGWTGTDYRPFYDSKGKQIGYMMMDLDLNDFLGRIFRFLFILVPVEALLVILLAFLSSGLLKRHIIDHLTAMAGAAREYIARDKVRQQEDAPLVFSSLDIRTANELEDLCCSMTEMETDVRDTMIRLRQITAEQERLGAELSIATQIQEGTLPQKFPAFPERDEFDIYASMIPAREVGGDLYDFFMVDEDHLGLVIGDVSGKGVSAALFMVIAKTLIQNQTQQGIQDPAEIFRLVNLKLMEVNKARMFVTAWLGVLEISTGEVRYVDAGHEYPAVRRKGGLFTVEEDVHCIPLAARKKAKFQSGSFRLAPGDSLYLYTDGVTEANNAEQEMYGRERMLAALNQAPDAAPQEIDRIMHESLEGFVHDAEQFDDVTMLCLKYFGF